MPSLGQHELDGGENAVVAAARAPANLLVRLEVLARQLHRRCRSSTHLIHHLQDVLFEVGGAERDARTSSRSSARRPGTRARTSVESWPRLISGTKTFGYAPHDVAQVRPGTGSGGGGARARPCGRGPRTRSTAALAAPHVPPQPSTSNSAPSSSSSSTRRDVVGDAGDLRGADVNHVLVVLGVVADVAGAVLFLETADAVLEPGRAGDRPRAGERLGIAQVGPELVAVVGLGGERHRDVGQRVDVGEQPRLGRRWPGSRRSGGSPASGTSARCGPPRTRRRSSPTATRAATIGSGDSPWRPYIASSRSACSVLVGRPVDGPPRCTSTMQHRQLEADRRARSPRDLRSTPGPLVRGHRQRARERRADRDAAAAISSSACKRLDAEVLELRQLVQDVGGRRDRIAARRTSGSFGLLRRRRPARRRAPTLPVMLRYVPGGERRGLDLVGMVEQLGRLAEVVARLEARRGWRRAPRCLLANFCSIHSTIGSVGRVYIQQMRPSAKKFFERSASRGLTPERLRRLDGDRRHRHLVHVVGVERAVRRGSSRSRPCRDCARRRCRR